MVTDDARAHHHQVTFTAQTPLPTINLKGCPRPYAQIATDNCTETSRASDKHVSGSGISKKSIGGQPHQIAATVQEPKKAVAKSKDVPNKAAKLQGPSPVQDLSRSSDIRQAGEQVLTGTVDIEAALSAYVGTNGKSSAAVKSLVFRFQKTALPETTELARPMTKANWSQI
jgi:hypothetical protein